MKLPLWFSILSIPLKPKKKTNIIHHNDTYLNLSLQKKKNIPTHSYIGVYTLSQYDLYIYNRVFCIGTITTTLSISFYPGLNLSFRFLFIIHEFAIHKIQQPVLFHHTFFFAVFFNFRNRCQI